MLSIKVSSSTFIIHTNSYKFCLLIKIIFKGFRESKNFMLYLEILSINNYNLKYDPDCPPTVFYVVANKYRHYFSIRANNSCVNAYTLPKCLQPQPHVIALRLPQFSSPIFCFHFLIEFCFSLKPFLRAILFRRRFLFRNSIKKKKTQQRRTKTQTQTRSNFHNQ